MTDFEKEVVVRVIEVINSELKYGSIEETLQQDLEFCVNSLEDLVK